jgi:hypothetical protein
MRNLKCFPMLVVTLLFLLAPRAGAEDLGNYFHVPDTWVPACWEKPPGGKYYHPCAADVLIQKGWIEQRHLAWLERAQEVANDTQLPGGARCFARMEAAMRAMDKFIPLKIGKGKYDTGPTWSLFDVFTDAQEQDYERAVKLWNSAKACWQEPPGP